MTATGQNVSMFKGDNHTITVTVRDAAGAVKDLTGATVKWAMNNTPNGTPKLSKSTITSGVAITDAPAGVCVVTIAQSDTISLAPNTYYHELEVTDAAGTKATVMTGSFVIKPALIA